MSTILDALRKSERSRREGKVPVYGNASGATTPSLLHWGSILAGVVLLIALIVFVWLLQRHPPEIVVETVSPGAETESRPMVATPSPAVTSAPDDIKANPEIRSKEKEMHKAAAPVAPPAIANRKSIAVSPRNPGMMLWSSLSEMERAGLPPLRVNIHVYVPDESQRILYIDNEPRVRGEEVAPGVMVEEIVPEGVIVRFRGQRYLLPRPS